MYAQHFRHPQSDGLYQMPGMKFRNTALGRGTHSRVKTLLAVSIYDFDAWENRSNKETKRGADKLWLIQQKNKNGEGGGEVLSRKRGQREEWSDWKWGVVVKRRGKNRVERKNHYSTFDATIVGGKWLKEFPLSTKKDGSNEMHFHLGE